MSWYLVSNVLQTPVTSIMVTRKGMAILTAMAALSCRAACPCFRMLLSLKYGAADSGHGYCEACRCNAGEYPRLLLKFSSFRI